MLFFFSMQKSKTGKGEFIDYFSEPDRGWSGEEVQYTRVLKVKQVKVFIFLHSPILYCTIHRMKW